VSSAAGGPALLNDLLIVDRHIPANGRRVLPYFSPLYRVVGGGETGLICAFTGAITDDRGRSITASATVNMAHAGVH